MFFSKMIKITFIINLGFLLTFANVGIHIKTLKSMETYGPARPFGPYTNEKKVDEKVDENIDQNEIIQPQNEPKNMAYDFCNTIDRWENGRKEVVNGNYHGVQIDGANVSFPFNGYANSYEWCYSQTPEMYSYNDVYDYTCNIYKSVNTCENFGEFYAEMEEK